jgi:hypothetical protein
MKSGELANNDAIARVVTRKSMDETVDGTFLYVLLVQSLVVISVLLASGDRSVVFGPLRLEGELPAVTILWAEATAAVMCIVAFSTDVQDHIHERKVVS